MADGPSDAVVAVGYVCVPCSLGIMVLAATERGLCALLLGDSEAELTLHLHERYPQAHPAEARDDLAGWAAQVQAYLAGQRQTFDIPLDVAGTAFQRRVWQALCAVPYGNTLTYQQLAEAIDQPAATRAVGHACGANPAALVIPCHRALRSDGSLSGYRWGVPRKAALLDLERFGV